jgi:hypothetical protein
MQREHGEALVGLQAQLRGGLREVREAQQSWRGHRFFGRAKNLRGEVLKSARCCNKDKGRLLSAIMRKRRNVERIVDRVRSAGGMHPRLAPVVSRPLERNVL